MTYYDKEFSRLGTLAATMKLQNEHGETRWITVTPEQVATIRERLTSGTESLQTIGASYGVDRKTIRLIRDGLTWRST